MQIAILGGTGALGGGLARRLATDTEHAVTVGSRDASRARDAATAYREDVAGGQTVPDDGRIEGAVNATAASGADVVVTAVPAQVVADLIETVEAELDRDAILVSPATAIDRTEHGFTVRAGQDESTTAAAAAAAPAGVPVVGAFHSLPAGRLADLEAPLGIDTLVVGDDPDARATIAELVGEIDGLRALDAGPLANAPAVESLTGLQLTIMMHDSELHDVGVRFD